MFSYEWIGFGLVLTVIIAVSGSALVSRSISGKAKQWILVGLLCIILGSLLRYYIYEVFYYGQKDARHYYALGLQYAERMANLDFSMFFDPSEWRFRSWWGTNFLDWTAGVVLFFTGPTQRGGYLAFGLLALVGRLLFWRSAHHSRTSVDYERFLLYLMLWPSLWWWTSVIGKDGIILLGLGLATYGYASADRIRWVSLALGMALVFAIRPEVAMVAMASLLIAQWLGGSQEWTLSRMLQGLLLVVFGIGVFLITMNLLGISSLAGAGSYIATNAENVSTGGSAVESVGVSWASAPFALVNVWLRPFPWEASNAFVFASGIEIYLLWGLVWYRWRNVKAAFSQWRSNRLLRFAIPFLLIYSVLLGMALTNLSIISRQRIFIFPFLFLLICWRETNGEKEVHEAEREERALATAR